MKYPRLMAVAVGFLLSGADIATLAAQQTPATPATPASAAVPASSPAAGNQLPAGLSLDGTTAEQARKIAEALRQLVAKANEAKQVGDNIKSKVDAGLRDFDTADESVRSELASLNDMLAQLKPDGDIMRELEAIERRYRLVVSRYEHSSNPALKSIADTAREKLKLTGDTQKDVQSLRQKLYDQVAKLNEQKDVLVAARQINSLDIALTTVREGLEKFGSVVAATQNLTETVSAFAGKQNPNPDAQPK